MMTQSLHRAVKRFFVSAAATLVLLTLSGCPSPEDDGPRDSCLDLQPAGQTMMVVGHGSGDDFQPLNDNSALEQRHGAQGGSHVEIAVRLYNQEDSEWVFDFSLVNDSNAEAGAGSWFAPSCRSGWSESSGLYVYLYADYGQVELVVTATEQGVADPKVISYRTPVDIVLTP